MPPNTALVTGGRGFIGPHLVNTLLARGVRVISVDLEPAFEQHHPNLVEVVGDVRNRELMRSVFNQEKVDIVLDLASFTEVGLQLADYQRNVEQTEAMTSYVDVFDIPKYVFYSTQFVHRLAGVAPKSEQDYSPIEAYGESKVMSEIVVRTRLEPSRWLILRPTYIWGPGLLRFRDGLLQRLARGQLLISDDENTRRYYGYVQSIVDQTLIIVGEAFDRLPQKVYYISDEAISLRAFCEFLRKALGTGRATPAPPVVIRLLGAIGSGMGSLGMHAPINSMQARELTTNFPIPLEPTLALAGLRADYAEAARRTVDWAMTDPVFRARVRRVA